MKKRGCKKLTIVRIKITPNLRAFFLVNVHAQVAHDVAHVEAQDAAHVEARVAVEEFVAAANRYHHRFYSCL